jgi:hypothetical protein
VKVERALDWLVPAITADTDRTLARIPLVAATHILTKLSTKICKRLGQYFIWTQDPSPLSQLYLPYVILGGVCAGLSVASVKSSDDLADHLMANCEQKVDAALFAAILRKISSQVSLAPRTSRSTLMKDVADTVSTDLCSEFKEARQGAALVLHTLSQSCDSIGRDAALSQCPSWPLSNLELAIRMGPTHWKFMPFLIDVTTGVASTPGDRVSPVAVSKHLRDEDSIISTISSLVASHSSARQSSRLISSLLEIKAKFNNKQTLTQYRFMETLILHATVSCLANSPHRSQEVMTHLHEDHDGKSLSVGGVMVDIWGPLLRTLCGMSTLTNEPLLVNSLYEVKSRDGDVPQCQYVCVSVASPAINQIRRCLSSKNSLPHENEVELSQIRSSDRYIRIDVVRALFLTCLYCPPETVGVQRADLLYRPLLGVIAGLVDCHDTVYSSDPLSWPLANLDIYALIASSRDERLSKILGDSSLAPVSVALQLLVPIPAPVTVHQCPYLVILSLEAVKALLGRSDLVDGRKLLEDLIRQREIGLNLSEPLRRLRGQLSYLRVTDSQWTMNKCNLDMVSSIVGIVAG